MYMYSFHGFKERLQYQYARYGKQLIMVDESYTSRTCTWCGHLRAKKSGAEILVCTDRGLVMDKDVIGARNKN